MTMSPDVLTRLLRGEHLDVEQRHALGLWPPEDLSYTQVLAHLTAVLQTTEWFPGPPVDSESVYVHRRGPQNYVCLVWPGQGSKSTERLFTNASHAAEFYLRWELNLPGSLDSWRVLDDREI